MWEFPYNNDYDTNVTNVTFVLSCSLEFIFGILYTSV
jgi:hypothetical protein